MRITRKPPTDFASLLRRGAAPEPQYGLLPFASSRAALEMGLRALGMTPGQCVLLPDYICDVVLHPLHRLSLRHQYYPLTEDLSPDWGALEALLSGADAALLLHPFGQPQDGARFGALCRGHGVVFIEDNAHGWGATDDGLPLEACGDIGIVSPWKQYGVPHGAFLHLADADASAKARNLWGYCPVEHLSLGLSFVKAVLRVILGRLPMLRLRLMRPPHQIPEPEFVPQSPTRPHPAVERFLARQRPERDAAVRRALYDVWEEWAVRCGVQPVFATLHHGAAPLCFPACVPAAMGDAQRKWLEWGWLHDIAVHTWPTLPPDLADDGPVQGRWRRLVCFPIHQGVRPEQLRRKLAACPPPSFAEGS